MGETVGGGWQLNKQGVTRTVLLIGPYAIKLPCLHYGWRNFLQGLLANMQERQWATMNLPILCPIVFSLPGGFLNVMPRCRILTDAEWQDYAEMAISPEEERGDFVVPVEHKSDSYGWLNGRIVAVDYGN
jgi:hypothetical protein